jgi:protein-tyrosine phosphatase
MIDIHSHILHGLDDGSPDLEESVAMARMAAEAGTTDIVASPHADLQFSFDPEVAEQKIAELTEACGQVVRIHYGCDFHIHFDNVLDALAHPLKYAINHKVYVLVELPELLVLKATEDVLERLRSAGMAVILTHPERNRLLQRRLDKIETWVVDRGCYVQLTAQSLLGRFGRKAKTCSEQLLERGLAHFVASDGHDTKIRPPRLDEARAWVAENFDEVSAERLFVANPAAVLTGETLPAGKIDMPRRRRPWWRF